LIGDWGFTYKWIGVTPLLKEYDIDLKIKRAGLNKAMPNLIDPIRE
jgi:hypothetical protein